MSLKLYSFYLSVWGTVVKKSVLVKHLLVNKDAVSTRILSQNICLLDGARGGVETLFVKIPVETAFV